MRLNPPVGDGSHEPQRPCHRRRAAGLLANPNAAWQGDATSVIEFLRPLREQLDAPGVLEVCINRPGELLVETVRGWQFVEAPEMTLERCLSLATAVATYCDQQINQERPLLSATLPSGERIQFVIPPAVTRGTVSITVRKPSLAIKRLDDFEREGLFERIGNRHRDPHADRRAAALRAGTDGAEGRRPLRRVPAPGRAQAPDHRRQRQDRLGQDHLHEGPGRGSAASTSG